jgi:hypothetical protein
MNSKKSVVFALKAALITFISLIVLFWFPSCKDEPFEYKIDRANAISFRLDTFDIVTASEVIFYEGPSVLHIFNDTTQVLFQRISLQAHGITPNSIEYWLIVDFDTHMDGNAVGSYLSQYDYEDGGINEMRLIIGNNSQFIEYKSVQELNSVYFQVDAQREEERIMKGVFGGILYQDGDPASQARIISDGVFKDIKY